MRMGRKARRQPGRATEGTRKEGIRKSRHIMKKEAKGIRETKQKE
jgi:hypothetical protein